jgi:hypothetical protein
LRLFHTDRDRAIAAYAKFIGDDFGRSDQKSPLSECNPNDSRILGSDAFAARILGPAWQPRSRKTFADLVAEACLQFSTSEPELRSPSCQRHLTRARAWIAHQAIAQRIISLSAVARHFHRTEGALRHSVKLHFNYP